MSFLHEIINFFSYKHYYVKEQPIYGSDRLGEYNSGNEVFCECEYHEILAIPAGPYYTRTVGNKKYELKDHLGDVRVVISDRKFSTMDENSNPVNFTADIRSYFNYYPFGMEMPGRTFNNDQYRFGFNGQERDNEVSGTGNINTAEYWEYDTRLGRRWDLDPKSTFGLSDFSVFGDNPILNIDPDGAYFFGLFGSTSEQRRTAKDLARATGGEVKNITSKNISVEFTSNSVSFEASPITGYTIHMESRACTVHCLPGGGPDFGNEAINGDFKGTYYRNLKIGEYDIYTGLPHGSGAVFAPTIDPIDVFAGCIVGIEASLGRAALKQTAEAVGSEMTTVGRWMSPKEYNMMKEGSSVLEGGGGQTYVTQGGSSLYSGAKRGSVYAEFQVPKNCLLGGGKEGWFRLLGPHAAKSQKLMLQKQGGSLLPRYQNLSPIIQKK